MRKSSKALGAAGGAVGLAGAAAFLGTCCVAPWAVTVLGVSGAVILARAAYLQPYLVLAAVIGIAMAFWWAYRRPATSEVCDAVATRRAKRLVWVGAVLMTILAAASFVPMFVNFV